MPNSTPPPASPVNLVQTAPVDVAPIYENNGELPKDEGM
jgi:hypothetical protein